MSSARYKPPSRVVQCLAHSEFRYGFFSPWLYELRQDSMSSFCDSVNRLIKGLKISTETYSFFSDSPLADRLVDSKQGQDVSKPSVANGSASVICIDNVWQWDPISAVAAYLRSASIVDQILTRLPCSEEGDTLVDWRLLSTIKDFPSLQIGLSTRASETGRALLEDLFMCRKQAEEIKLIQMSLIDVAFNLNAPHMDKLIKIAEPLRTIPRAIFNTLCQRKRYEYLPVLELAVAATEAEAASEMSNASLTSATASIEDLLRHYENALMLAHSEDAASNVSILTDDDALQNCRPILLKALRDAVQLANPDKILLALIRLIWLLPSRGCNPNSRANASLVGLLDDIFQIITSSATIKGSAFEKFLSIYNPTSMGRCLLAAAYRRHLLPSYRESVRNVDFPQLTSPVVQMFKDLAEAHQQPSNASPALKSLRHRPVYAEGASASDGSDPTLLSNVSKLIAMSGVVSSRRPPLPYTAPMVILVTYSTITWTLAREIVSAVTRSASQPLEVLIVCNSLLRGHDVFHECLL